MSCNLNGQILSQNDTVRIGEVIIQRSKLGSELPGYKTERLDSSILENYSQLSLAEILDENLNISVKSYGMGGTATATFRGTGAGHTKVEWNGINLGNPMLGQSDLSLITTGMTDEITVYYGGASMPLDNGGIGGVINLITGPDWDRGTKISVSTGTGSFGHYSGLLKFKKGTQKFQSSTKIFAQISENDFRYLDDYSGPEPVWQTRTHNQVNHKSLIQEFYLKGPRSVTSAHFWYQLTDRNLPSSLLTQQAGSDERQSDEALRSMISYHFTGDRTDYMITGAWVRNRLNYSNRLASIDSRNLSDASIVKMTGSRAISGSSRLGFTIVENLDIIHTNNYRSVARRNKTSMTALLDSRLSPSVSTVILIREIMDRNRFLVPDFSTALELKLLPLRDYCIKASISKNSKLPGMNDLYWYPGGNPDLKNEYSFNYEISYSMNENITPILGLRYELTGYRNNIRDMIQWLPGEYSYWTAYNLKSINSYGMETSLTLRYVINSISAELKSGYTLTRAENKANEPGEEFMTGKQLIYVPVNKANAALKLTYNNIFALWTSNFTGKRYITSDNSRFLPGYYINNLYGGIRYRRKNISVLTELGVDNIFNVYYQTIAYYPLPGRFYTLKILLQILNKQ